METQKEHRKIINSLIYPSLFVLVIWMVKFSELVFHTSFASYGLRPLHFSGLAGIVTAPLLHVSFSHLSANSVPLFILGGLLFFSYRVLAWRIVLLIWLTTGLWVWLFARGDAVHVGASGIVYGLASFLFFSGIFRRETGLMAITLLVTFIYGGIIWGLFPQLFPKENISWESHLMGLVSGLVLAYFFRKSGPQRKQYSWEFEEEEEEEYDEMMPDEEKEPTVPPGTP